MRNARKCACLSVSLMPASWPLLRSAARIRMLSARAMNICKTAVPRIGRFRICRLIPLTCIVNMSLLSASTVSPARAARPLCCSTQSAIICRRKCIRSLATLSRLQLMNMVMSSPASRLWSCSRRNISALAANTSCCVIASQSLTRPTAAFTAALRVQSLSAVQKRTLSA